jgi:DNA-binding transcriptional LysR family regulator
MKFRFNDVQNFLATSSCRTINQAANKLEISQPALSESLKRLEQDLGHVLFYRSRSGVELTPSGKAFLPKAQALIKAYDDLTIPEGNRNLFGDRVISIGCHAIIAQYFVPEALAWLQSVAPDFKIELRHDISRKVQESVQTGLIDLAIVANPVEVPGLVITPIGSDQVGVWSASKTANPDTIICNLDLFQSHSILSNWKKKPSRLISTDSLELICRLVSKNIGLGIIPARAVELSRLPLYHQKNLPVFRDTICLIHRPEFGRNNAEKLVIEAIMESSRIIQNGSP